MHRYFNENTGVLVEKFQGLMSLRVRHWDSEAPLNQVLHYETGENLYMITSAYINSIDNGWLKLAGGCSDHSNNVYGNNIGLKGRVCFVYV